MKAVSVGEPLHRPAEVFGEQARALEQTRSLAQQLQQALDHRAMIDQVIGVLMSRQDAGLPKDIDCLRLISQTDPTSAAEVADSWSRPRLGRPFRGIDLTARAGPARGSAPMAGQDLKPQEVQRVIRLRTERLQRTLTALVASASLTEVTAALFQHGLASFGASGARLALIDPERPGRLVTAGAVGFTESLLIDWETLPVETACPERAATAAGTVVYLPTDDHLAADYPGVHHVLTRSGHHAWAALPLVSRGVTVGVLTLGFFEPYPLDDGPDRIALAALSSAVADALAQAIQHDSDHDLATSVQRSLLPKTLPESPGVHPCGRYFPADGRYAVSGDWYDAVPLPGGRMLLVVGDVAGHGLSAAITMGQLRSAARALASTHGPAALLEELDRFAAGVLGESIATAAVVLIDSNARTMSYSLAGHPSPLLRAPDGTVTALEQATGVLLGLQMPGRPEQMISFDAASVLVLFTDGLVERRDESMDVGMARLVATLQTSAFPELSTLCDALIEHSLPPAGRNDDTALLCALLT